ncbi:MAG: hypothetical protein ACYDAL_10400 [Candidatus Dormibacteraceae bacterium]
MAESSQAVASGEIGFAHLKAMVRTANPVGSKLDEAPPLTKARESSPGKFYHLFNHQPSLSRAQGMRASRRTWLRPATTGMRTRGLADRAQR